MGAYYFIILHIVKSNSYRHAHTFQSFYNDNVFRKVHFNNSFLENVRNQ